MKVKISGLVQTNNTRLISGVNTLFRLELRPGDTIEVAGNTAMVQGIFSDVLLSVSVILPQSAGQSLYILQANPAFLLTTKPPVYADYWSSFTSHYFNDSMSDYNSLTTPILIGGQALNRKTDLPLATLNYVTKSIELPAGYEYFSPYINLSVVKTTAGSTIVTPADTDTMVSTTAGSNIIIYRSGNTKFLKPGMCITIESKNYVIGKRIRTRLSGSGYEWLDSDIYLDRAVDKTYTSVKLSLNQEYESMYPANSYVLLNGKLNIVKSTLGKSVQFRYPIDATSEVTIRRPLMATQYGINTTEFFGIPFDSSLLDEGNLLVVQDIHGEDSLYQVHSCYTEIKHIGRALTNNKVITTELNGTPFTGIAVFGRNAFGLRKFRDYVYCNGNAISTLSTYNFPSDLSGGDYIMVNNEVYNITSGQYWDQALPLDRPIAAGHYEVYMPIEITSIPTYNDLVNNLALKLAQSIIKTGHRRISNINSLLEEFLTTWEFSTYKLGQPRIIFSVYEPEYFAIDRYSSPRVQYEQQVAVMEAASTVNIELEQVVIRQCGLVLSSARG